MNGFSPASLPKTLVSCLFVEQEALTCLCCRRRRLNGRCCAVLVSDLVKSWTLGCGTSTRDYESGTTAKEEKERLPGAESAADYQVSRCHSLCSSRLVLLLISFASLSNGLNGSPAVSLVLRTNTGTNGLQESRSKTWTNWFVPFSSAPFFRSPSSIPCYLHTQTHATISSNIPPCPTPFLLINSICAFIIEQNHFSVACSSQIMKYSCFASPQIFRLFPHSCHLLCSLHSSVSSFASSLPVNSAAFVLIILLLPLLSFTEMCFHRWRWLPHALRSFPRGCRAWDEEVAGPVRVLRHQGKPLCWVHHE